MRVISRLEKYGSYTTKVEKEADLSVLGSGSPESRGTRSDSELSLVTKRGDDNGFDDSVHSEDATASFLCNGEGYLRKENRRGRFQRRFFATNNAYLNYYYQKSAYSSDDRSLPSASIDLRAADTICILSRNGKPTRKFAIQTRQGTGLQEECFFLKARTLEEAVRWVQILQRRRDYWSAQPSGQNVAASPVKRGPLLPGPSDASKKYLELDENSSSAADDDGEWWRECVERSGSTSSAESSEGVDSADDGFITGQDDETDEEFNSSVECKESEEEAMDTWHAFKDMPYETSVLQTLRTVPRLPNPSKYWVEPDVRKLRIRGKSYMEDSQKVQATEPLFKLFAIDMYKTNGRLDHVAAHPQHRVAHALKRKKKLPFMFIVNMQIPGPPFYSYVVTFVATKRLTEALSKQAPGEASSTGLPTGFAELAQRFFAGAEDSLRDCRFKLCPRIVEGPFVVRHGVPNKPAILGKKLTQRYFRSENYLELCIDIGSSTVAWKLTQMSLRFSKLITVDLAFVLQGNSEEELPEKVIGIARAIKPDFSEAVELD